MTAAAGSTPRTIDHNMIQRTQLFHELGGVPGILRWEDLVLHVGTLKDRLDHVIDNLLGSTASMSVGIVTQTSASCCVCFMWGVYAGSNV